MGKIASLLILSSIKPFMLCNKPYQFFNGNTEYCLE